MEYSMKYSLQLLHTTLKNNGILCAGEYEVCGRRMFDFGFGQWDCSTTADEHTMVINILDFIENCAMDKDLVNRCLKQMNGSTPENSLPSSMTRRDHVAALLLAGFYSSGRKPDIDIATETAVRYADALIAELDKPRDK